MRRVICILAMMGISACSDEVRDPVTFSCISSGEGNSNPGQQVRFHFAEGYLFLQNDAGAAENVCSKRGTVDCSVKMTRSALTLRQAVEDPYCGYRPVVKTNLDIDRATGAFRLLQEGCDPQQDMVITGQCE